MMSNFSDNEPQSGMGQSGYNSLGAITQNDRLMALIAHLLPFLSGFLGPLVVYALKKDQSKFVEFHALQALVFHIALTISLLISAMLCFIVIGFLLVPVVAIAGSVFSVIAAVKANNGEWYELPFVGSWVRRHVGA